MTACAIENKTAEVARAAASAEPAPGPAEPDGPAEPVKPRAAGASDEGADPVRPGSPGPVAETPGAGVTAAGQHGAGATDLDAGPLSPWPQAGQGGPGATGAALVPGSHVVPEPSPGGALRRAAPGTADAPERAAHVPGRAAGAPGRAGTVPPLPSVPPMPPIPSMPPTLSVRLSIPSAPQKPLAPPAPAPAPAPAAPEPQVDAPALPRAPSRPVPPALTIAADHAYAARLTTAGKTAGDAWYPERWTLDGPEPYAVPLPLDQPEEADSDVLPLSDGRVLIRRRVGADLHTFSLLYPTGPGTGELSLGSLDCAELALLPPSPDGMSVFALLPGAHSTGIWLVAGGAFGPEHVADVPGRCSGGVWLDREGRLLSLDRQLPGGGPVKAVVVDLERGGEVTPLLQICLLYT
ncbi:hypothetical protein, partial [Streptomyces sp. NRRL S-15]|uniref:hypothetical protein n=1 Tax=Streptomyces sp. NRRL S-15 TaxID=1463886 RepID=UPI001F2A3A42